MTRSFVFSFFRHNSLLACTRHCVSAPGKVSREHFYLLEADQQVSSSSERGPLGA